MTTSDDKILHVGDYGPRITLVITDRVTDQIVDLSSATVKTFTFKKPDGTKITKTASFLTDGTDGKLVYDIQNGDLSTAGRWHVEAVVTFATSKYTSDSVQFEVYPNL